MGKFEIENMLNEVKFCESTERKKKSDTGGKIHCKRAAADGNTVWQFIFTQCNCWFRNLVNIINKDSMVPIYSSITFEKVNHTDTCKYYEYPLEMLSSSNVTENCHLSWYHPLSKNVFKKDWNIWWIINKWMLTYLVASVASGKKSAFRDKSA